MFPRGYRGFASQADHFDYHFKLDREMALIDAAEEEEARQKAEAYYDEIGAEPRPALAVMP